MNIKLQGIDLLGNLGLKSTQDRLNRQAERDNKIAFFEQQKENLKNMKADTIDEIAKKLAMFHGYEDQIAAAKMEYNNAQMFHVFDEAQELAEKIAEAAEKNEPKTPEDMIEEATGVENDGLLDELMDNLTDAVEEVTEEMVEDLQQSSEEILSEDELNQMMLTEEELEKLEQEKRIPVNYIPFDYRI